MTRLALALTVLVAPLVATSSLAQDTAYWQAAHTWQTSSPVTYYTHTIVILLAAIVAYRNRRPKLVRPPGPSGNDLGGQRRGRWTRRD